VGARRGPKLEVWGGVLGDGVVSPSPSARSLGEHCKLPQWVPGDDAKSFGVFWVLRVSSSAVLLLDLAVIHSSFCGSARKLLWGRKDTFAPAVSALRGRAPPLPSRFRRLCFVATCLYCRFSSCYVHRGNSSSGSL